MSFTLTIHNKHHEKLTDELAKLPHVTLPSGEEPGTITAENGVKLAYRVTGHHQVTVDVVENPVNEPEAEIEKQLQQQVNQILAA